MAVLFASRDPVEAIALAGKIRKKTVRKLASRIYTTDMDGSPEEIIRDELFAVIRHFYRLPDGHRGETLAVWPLPHHLRPSVSHS